MSILSVDTIQPIGSGSTVTLNAAKTAVGTGITFESNGQAIYAGIITATSFSGSGANLTSLPAQATIANNADNRVITGGSGVNLNGEATLTYNGTSLLLGSGAIATPKVTQAGSLDLDSGGISLCIGGNENSNGRTNSTNKLNRIVTPHYTNAEEPMAMISGYSTSGASELFYGGGSGLTNAATSHYFYTASGSTTTSGTERLRIASDGKITVAANSDIRFTNGTWTGEVAGKIQQNSNNLYIQGGTGGIRFRHASSGVNQFSMTNGGNFEITNGDVVVASGHGIDFSATAANAGRTTTQELLDDYEEGTFTASMQGGSNSGSFSGSQQSRYVKIGKQVTCWIMIHGDLSGASGNLEWTGFPFTSENPQEAVGVLQFNAMRGGMPSGTNTVCALMHPGLTRVHFRCNADGNNTAYTALSSSTNYGFTYARLVITYTTSS